MANQSTVTEFLLMGFSDVREMQILHFITFFFIYLIALIGNFLLLTAVLLNHHLHTPMYFFLANLSLSDVCLISTVIPKSMVVSLINNKLISYAGCVTQLFSFATCAGSELALLTIMAYDRYVAICHPLQYEQIMNWNACVQMAVASWVSTLSHALLQTTVTFRLHFCKSNIIEQFFCDIPQLQKISCSDTRFNQILIFVIAMTLDAFCVGFIFGSYAYIFSAVLKMSSIKARHKVFSTCIPHMTVFTLFVGTAYFSYMKPKTLSTPTINLFSAVLYTVLPPVLNPIIYSLRNKDILEGIKKIGPKIKQYL